MTGTHPLRISAPGDEAPGKSVGRFVQLALLVLVSGVIVRSALAVTVIPHAYGVAFAMTVLVLAPLGLYLVAVYRRARTNADRQLAVGFSVTAAAMTLVGFDRTSVWFAAVSIASGAGFLALSWIASASTKDALQIGALILGSAAGAFAVTAGMILLVPASFFRWAYLDSAGAGALAVGPLVVAGVMALSKTLVGGRGAPSGRETPTE